MDASCALRPAAKVRRCTLWTVLGRSGLSSSEVVYQDPPSERSPDLIVSCRYSGNLGSQMNELVSTHPAKRIVAAGGALRNLALL